jgi:beta-N-acetylhexosaminidase
MSLEDNVNAHMNEIRVKVGMAVALVGLVLVATNALAVGASTTTTTPTTTTTSSTTTSAPPGLACAIQMVSSWPLTRVANETIVVPVNAANLGAMVPAATSGYAGLLLFGNSAPVNMAAVLARVQARTPSKYPMLVMTDEEGGGVQRLTNVIGSIPWAQTMGKNLSASRILGQGSRIGASLMAAGVNTDLAPVLDVDGRAVQPGAVDPDGMRSFSGTPSIAAVDGTAFMQGLADAGVTSVVKHFPGLGGSSRNTDYGPATTKPWSVLKTTGLVPFEYAIARGASAVMLSNASVPGLTSLPASLSPVVVQELRQNLGFNGLIITDSLSAGAISALHLDDAAASVKALEAGANLVLYGLASSPAASLELARGISTAIVAAVTDGWLSRATLNRDAAMVVSTRNTVSC